jgi:glyoxylate/hydroxypyruvate reductase A
MVNIYVDPSVKDVEVFKEVLAKGNVDFNVYSTLEKIEPEDVEVAIIWLSVPEYLSDFVNLKLLLTSGSGIDQLVQQGKLPDVPTVRLVDYKLRNKVANYVLNAVNGYKESIHIKQTSEITIGLMGLGLIGKANYHKLREAGYSINCWVRSNRNREIDNIYIGTSQLEDFVKKCNVLVCQLPLTEKTHHILDMEIFDLMPQDGYIINVGRGAHLNEKDLISAIETGKLKGACLDVFKIEPLPKDNILRNQSGITLTPHIAGGIFPEEQSKYAIEVISIFLKQGQVEGEVNRKMSY